ncbi:MAG: HNH endonuclease [Thermoleophilia bacterium]
MSALWRDSSAGAAKRVAHYLATEVGEGNIFEKSQLREVVPNTEQVDRRMRDLRKVGWKIRTYKDSADLKPHQLKLEAIGLHVWEDGFRWPGARISAATRRKLFERDGARCLVCGIDPETEYPDLPGVRPRLTIGHVIPLNRGGTDDLDNLRLECHLCNEQARDDSEPPIDPDLVTRRVLELSKADKRTLAQWMLAGRRSFTALEKLWAQYNQMPAPHRERIRKALSDALSE